MMVWQTALCPQEGTVTGQTEACLLWEGLYVHYTFEGGACVIDAVCGKHAHACGGGVLT